MSDDPWGDPWGNEAVRSRAEAEAEMAERQRRTIAELLLVRKEERAAAIVAISGLRVDQVDSWQGGLFEVIIEVPSAQFDLVDADTRLVLEAAARDVTGANHFSGLGLEVRLADHELGWDQQLIEQLLRQGPADQHTRLALPQNDGSSEGSESA